MYATTKDTSTRPGQTAQVGGLFVVRNVAFVHCFIWAGISMDSHNCAQKARATMVCGCRTYMGACSHGESAYGGMEGSRAKHVAQSKVLGANEEFAWNCMAHQNRMSCVRRMNAYNTNTCPALIYSLWEHCARHVHPEAAMSHRDHIHPH